MKIIDLLNKISNGEEAPEKIAIQNDVLIYNEDEILNLQDCYYMNDDKDATWKIWAYSLNDEVEILYNEDEDIEEIDFKTAETQKEKNRIMKDKINALVREVNKLKKEGK